MVLVPGPCHGEHDQSGGDVRGCNQALRHGDAEAHAVAEDDWQEESDRICDGGGEAEDGCEGPHFQVESATDILA